MWTPEGYGWHSKEPINPQPLIRKLLAVERSGVEGSWKPQRRDSKIHAARKLDKQ